MAFLVAVVAKVSPALLLIWVITLDRGLRADGHCHAVDCNRMTGRQARETRAVDRVAGEGFRPRSVVLALPSWQLTVSPAFAPI